MAQNLYGSDLKSDDKDMLEEFSLICPSSTGQTACTPPLCQHSCQSAYQQLREHFILDMKNNSSHLPTYQSHDQQTFFDGPENPFPATKSTFQLTLDFGQ